METAFNRRLKRCWRRRPPVDRARHAAPCTDGIERQTPTIEHSRLRRYQFNGSTR
jgi:hypothetical protein